MANSASSRKRVRKAERRHEHQVVLRSRMRTYVKRVQNLIISGDGEAGVEAYKVMQKHLDSASSKGLIHKKKAARLKSRLNTKLKALATS